MLETAIHNIVFEAVGEEQIFSFIDSNGYIRRVAKPSFAKASDFEHFRDRARGLMSGLNSGLRSANRRLTLPAGGVTVVAGSPGEGKTSLMLNLLRNLLRSEPDKRFYFFSYEESDIYLALKLLMIGSNVVLADDNLEAFIKHFRAASWRGSDETNGKLAHAVDEFGAWIGEGRLHIDDQGLDLYALDEKIRATCSQEETGAIFIDYIQKVRLPGGSQIRDRYAQLKEVSGHLLTLANRLQVPVVVGAQLNRGVRAWPPSLDHIRESSDIGQDASLVLALKRVRRAKEEHETLKVHVVKNRRGPAHFNMTFAFRGATYRVDSLNSAEVKAQAKLEVSTVVEGGVWLPLDAKAAESFVQWG